MSETIHYSKTLKQYPLTVQMWGRQKKKKNGLKCRREGCERIFKVEDMVVKKNSTSRHSKGGSWLYCPKCAMILNIITR